MGCVKRTLACCALLSLLMVSSFLGKAQEKPVYWGADSAWHFYGSSSLTFNQVALMNWVAGGENTLSLEAAQLLGLDFKRGKMSWNNTLNLGYGVMKQGKSELRKHLDLIDFSSKFGYEAMKTLYYSALFGLSTQFAPGYKYPERKLISDFAAPLYVNLSLGLDYKPDDHFSLFFSPLTGRMTYVRNMDLADIGAFGVKKAEFDEDGLLIKHGEQIRWELGGLLKATYRNSFFKNTLGVNSTLELFSNYLAKPENVDVNFDLVLDYKLSNWLTARAQITLIYDDDKRIVVNPDDPPAQQYAVPKLQLRQMFGLGLAYRF